MKDFRQSKLWAEYMKFRGWRVEKLPNANLAFVYPLPFSRSIIRIPRIGIKINFSEIDSLAKKNRAIFAKLEPDVLDQDISFRRKLTQSGYKQDHWSIEPTKTLTVDLSQTEEKLWMDLRKNWRTDIKIAQKNHIKIIESEDIKTFIKIWNINAKKKGFLIETSSQTEKLFSIFSSKNQATLLFAQFKNKIIGATFLIFDNISCHLWHIASTGEYLDKQPLHLLLWKSILKAKSRRAQIFDFEGIEDPRLPYTKKFQSTHFKTGFGGKEVTLIGSWVKYYTQLAPLIFFVTFIKPDIIRSFYRRLSRL